MSPVPSATWTLRACSTAEESGGSLAAGLSEAACAAGAASDQGGAHTCRVAPTLVRGLGVEASCARLHLDLNLSRKAPLPTNGETEAREVQRWARGLSVPSHCPFPWGSHRHAPLQHPESLGLLPSPGRHRCQDVWGVGPLISHIIFGISHSLGELENVIVKAFLNVCLLSRKML